MSQAASSASSGLSFGGDSYGSPQTSVAGAPWWVSLLPVGALAAAVLLIVIFALKRK